LPGHGEAEALAGRQDAIDLVGVTGMERPWPASGTWDVCQIKSSRVETPSPVTSGKCLSVIEKIRPVGFRGKANIEEHPLHRAGMITLSQYGIGMLREILNDVVPCTRQLHAVPRWPTSGLSMSGKVRRHVPTA